MQLLYLLNFILNILLIIFLDFFNFYLKLIIVVYKLFILAVDLYLIGHSC